LIYPTLFYQAKTLKKARLQKTVNDISPPFKCFLYILYEQKQWSYTPNVEYKLGWINVENLLKRNTPELLGNSKNVPLSPTPLCVIKTDNFILVIEEKQIGLYNISPTSHCQHIYSMVLSNEAHLKVRETLY
jgi:hypothetical protein